MQRATDANNGDGPPALSLSPAVAQQIAQVFGFTGADVLVDAHQIATWAGPADDLLVWIERRYHWSARSAFVYMFSLECALRSSKPEHREHQ